MRTQLTEPALTQTPPGIVLRVRKSERVRVFALSIVLTVVMVALALVVFTGSWSGLGEGIFVALLYAMPMILFATALMPRIERLAKAAPPPWGWAVFGTAQLLLATLGVAIANWVMSVADIHWLRGNFLPVVNRVAVVMSFSFGMGARVFASVKERLEERNRALEKKVADESLALQVHQQDFERAREMQEGLLPKQLPRVKGCELAAGWQPARVVGGDYFDLIRLSDTSVAIAIADVVGKGMAAALLMSNLQAIVRSFAPTGLTAAQLCDKANQVIAGNIAPGKFITFFYAVLDIETMRLDYSSAGHNPPFLIRADGKVERLPEGGAVLGVFPGARYSGATVDVRKGDRLFLYTDGITEAMNEANEEFGEERLVPILVENRAKGAGDMQERVMAAVTAFTSGAFQDDATILVAALD